MSEVVPTVNQPNSKPNASEYNKSIENVMLQRARENQSVCHPQHRNITKPSSPSQTTSLLRIHLHLITTNLLDRLKRRLACI